MADINDNGKGTTKDYEVRKLALINSFGKKLESLEAQLVELQITQSIDAPVMYGKALFSDAQDLIAAFVMTGNELLEIVIDEPTLNMPFEKTFRVFKIENRMHNNNSAAKYVLHFVSPELLKSNSTLVSKAYVGKRCSDMVSDILNNVLQVKKVSRIESTSGAFDLVVPSFRPIQAIDWLATRSFNGPAAINYEFFETRDGFEFVSMQTLYKGRVTKNLVYDIKSVNENPNSSTDIARNRNSIEKLTIKKDFDMISTVAKGGFASKLLTVNLLSQEYKFYDYSIEREEKNLLNGNKTTNDQSLTKGYSASFKTYVTTENRKAEKENSVEKWLMPGRMHKAVVDSLVINAVLPGDITLRPGNIVKLDLPKFVAADESGKQLDELRSGKYLIRSVIHIFRQNGTFDSTIELTTDSYARALPTSSGSKAAS